MNSNKVFKFSGLGLVTKMLEYECSTARAIERPSAADLPRPRAAVSDTVCDSDLDVMASVNVKIALAWSRVLASARISPTPFVSAMLSFRARSSASPSCSRRLPLPDERATPTPRSGSIGSMSLPAEIGRTFSSSSTMRQDGLLPSERRKRSLKRATGEAEDIEDRYRA